MIRQIVNIEKYLVHNGQPETSLVPVEYVLLLTVYKYESP